MRMLLGILSITMLVGCTAFETKVERYQEVGEKLLNPDHLDLQVKRRTQPDGSEKVTVYEMRCSGAECDDLIKGGIHESE